MPNILTDFNETVSLENGSVIDAQSQGDVTQLATAVFDAPDETIGAAPMPNLLRINHTTSFLLPSPQKISMSSSIIGNHLR